MFSVPVSGPARESETVSLMMTADTLCYLWGAQARRLLPF